MTPIETEYRGYRFRSRLEARWAVVFDQLEIDYWYEPEGFRLDRFTYYLPDFYLPSLRLFAEVKPDRLTPEEMRKCELLAVGSRKSVLLLCGPPDFRTYDVIFCNQGDPYPTTTDALLDIDYHGRKHFSQGRLWCSTGGEFRSEDDFSKQYRDAVYRSRGYRFEEAA